MTIDFIHVRGAKEHNLKNVTVSIPKKKLTVITGPSGSGKSSLAFDTIFVESHRCYIESSIPPYARQFLPSYNRPNVDIITGLSPSVAINQRAISHSPRSTVATITEIYDYLRLLFTNLGSLHSLKTGLPIKCYDTFSILEYILHTLQGKKIYLLSPKTFSSTEEISKVAAMGYSRIKINNRIYSDFANIPKDLSDQCGYIVIDRFVVERQNEERLLASIKTALQANEKQIVIEESESGKMHDFPLVIGTDDFFLSKETIDPRLFSFNSPRGACSSCSGLGTQLILDPECIIFDPQDSILDNIDTLEQERNMKFGHYLKRALTAAASNLRYDLSLPWNQLPQTIQDNLLHGCALNSHKQSRFPGILQLLKDTLDTPTYKKLCLKTDTCTECQGYRICTTARHIKIQNRHIGEILRYSIHETLQWAKNLESRLSEYQKKIGAKPLEEIKKRLEFLCSVGLQYLTLDRIASNLSGGEAQRVKLASQIGSGLTNILCILDEPSIGLHKHDTHRLLESLQMLKKLDNTVIVIEHDDDTIRAADYIIDMGPVSGKQGGHVIAEGTLENILGNPNSITGACLRNPHYIPLPEKRRPIPAVRTIRIEDAHLNNLKHINVEIPLGRLISITGVSGSGKSTLAIDILCHAVSHFLKKRLYHQHVSKISGLDYIDKVIDVDQLPIGRTSRSNLATYIGIFGHIRKIFSMAPRARARGYTPSTFSFNARGGRCESCEGTGTQKISMHFMPDLFITCETCHGKSYNSDILEVYYKDKNIYDVLNSTVDEAEEFFSNIIFIREKLTLLKAVGLGYLTLGQLSNTLSGGEEQRIKLTRELSKKTTGRTLYVLDEPSTGLHTCDIKKLIKILEMLVDMGNTVVIIEHNLDLIKITDYVIDMGPSGGINGGQVVASGTPEDIASHPESITGKFLKSFLETHS